MAAFAQALRGLAIPLADSHVTTYLQRTTPPEMLGRVLANVYGGVGIAAAVGYLLGPGAGRHFAAHSVRSRRLPRAGRRGRHRHTAAQAVGRDRLVIAAAPSASGGLEGEGQVVVDEADDDRAFADS
jgi:hypothetical protein